MLKVRVTFNVHGKFVQKYFSTDIELSEAQWSKIKSGTVPFSLRKMREDSLKFEARANDIINTNPSISIELFEALYVGRYSKGAGISVLYQEVIDKMTAEGRISTASSYEYSLKSLVSHQGGDFPLNIIDRDFLERYEKAMLEKGEKATTVGFYLRALRSIFNIAIEKRIISQDLYPFGRKGYTIPKGSNFKKALKKADKVKLEKVKTTSEQEKRALSMWLFSYYCNGMNFTDMAYLKPANVHEEVIVFVRRKTMRTVREVKPIVVPIRKEVGKILLKYGIHEPYCFGIITDEMTAEEKYRRIRDWIKLTNKYVNQVTKRLGISGKINTYSARHTFATVLLKGNADIKAIQQSLGHKSISTTESYLADLDIDEAKKMSNLL